MCTFTPICFPQASLLLLVALIHVGDVMPVSFHQMQDHQMHVVVTVESIMTDTIMKTPAGSAVSVTTPVTDHAHPTTMVNSVISKVVTKITLHTRGLICKILFDDRKRRCLLFLSNVTEILKID